MSLSGRPELFSWIIYTGLMLVLVEKTSGLKSHAVHLPSVSKDQHPTCKNSDVLHSDIVNNGILKAKREHANLTFLGRVRNMKECLGLCCSYIKCKLAYLENNTKCFSTKCTNSDLCRILKIDQKNNVKISLMVKKEPGNSVYITAVYIVMVMAAFGAALSGTVWVVYVFVNKYNESKTINENECEKLVDEPQVY